MKKMILFTASFLLGSQLLFASTNEENKAMAFEDLVRDLKIELLEPATKKAPSIVFINKCGEVVAELYGNSEELNEKFQEMIQKGHLMSKSSTLSVYLVQ